MTRIGEVLAAARRRVPAGEARSLLSKTLAQTEAWLFAHDDSELSAEQLTEFEALLARRSNGEPLAYLTGQREFYGRMFATTPAALIPRPETELLVEIALAAIDRRASATSSVVSVLELGTGTGCIATTLALERPNVTEVTAVDISADALSLAQRNAAFLGAVVRFLRSDWFHELPSRNYDVIVANPPYIAADDDHLKQGDLRFEPTMALVGGRDGLDALRTIIGKCGWYLNSVGELWLEHGYDQARAVYDQLHSQGIEPRQYRDLAGIVRVSGGVMHHK